MEIGIIGGGSVGLLLCSYLSRHHHVTLYVRRKEQLAKIQKKSVTLYVGGTRKFTSNGLCVEHMSKLPGNGTLDCVFVCVKQPHLKGTLPLLSTINQHAAIIFLQNGMGHLPLLDPLSNPLVLGTVEHGATRMNDYQINHLGSGRIMLAPYSMAGGELFTLANKLDKVDFIFQYTADYLGLLKQKLIVNAVINPLTAIFNVDNGAVLSNKHIRSLARKLCEESALVLQLDKGQAWALIKEIAQNTAKNISSMRSDVLAGKPTEIREISGYLLEISNLGLPYTDFVYQAILGIEEGRGSNHETNV